MNRTEEDQSKIIDKDAKNKFKWSWLVKFVTVEIEKKSHKMTLADCIEIVFRLMYRFASLGRRCQQDDEILRKCRIYEFLHSHSVSHYSLFAFLTFNLHFIVRGRKCCILFRSLKPPLPS